MTAEYTARATKSVLNSKKGFCKFLSANDTGATGGHQSGILISKSAIDMMFNRQELEQNTIPKRTVKIRWQDDFETVSRFTFYESKNELRITRFGRGFPFLKPEQTGALFVLTQQTDIDYSGYFLETDEEIEEFLDTFGISPIETNGLIDTGKVSSEMQEKWAIQDFIDSLDVDFPTSDIMSAAARMIEGKTNNHKNYIITNPDEKIISWTNTEYTLFRALEYARYGNIIVKGFQSVDDHVNSLHSRIKAQYKRYRSVASKYINRYAALFRIQELYRKINGQEMITSLLMKFRHLHTTFFIRQIQNESIFNMSLSN